MRTLVIILLVVSSLALGKTKKSAKVKAKPKGKQASSEHHVFSGMKLQGSLRKPELNYAYSTENLVDDQILEIPDDFNNEIIKETP